MRFKRRWLVYFPVCFPIALGAFLLLTYLEPRPNILLITIDALRPDHLACYGYSLNTSPHIDNLAKEGILFSQAIAQSSITFSSLPSLFTSTFPSSHGIEELKDEVNFLNPSALTLAQILKDKGYHTGAISGHGLIFSSVPGLDSGFDTIKDMLDAPANEITQHAVKWLGNNRDRAHFLWIHYMDTHARYQPPFPYDRLHLPIELKKQERETLIKKYEWTAFEWAKGRIVFFPKQSSDGSLTEENRKYYISQYDGEIGFVDEQIGILLGELKQLGLDKKTLIILTSDHGENLADYNKYFAHGFSLYDVELKVPLIIKINGRKSISAKVIGQQVQSIDIMPTILDILKIGKYNRRKLEGRSFLPLILNRKKEQFTYAFSELSNVIKNRILKSVRTADWKLVYDLSKRTYELYNLKNDPGETNNLIETEKDMFKLLKKKLEEWQARPRPRLIKAAKPLNEETKKRLRNLGYLQ